MECQQVNYTHLTEAKVQWRPLADKAVTFSIPKGSRLGGVVVSVLATRPKGFGFEPGQGNGFLKAIKIRSTPSSRTGVKAGRSHVVRFYGM
jgi:hypothetical protein